MLALTRRVNEEVVIGDPANPIGVIRVVDIHGDKVRLSFEFPRDIEINRRELADQKAEHAGKPRPRSADPGGANKPAKPNTRHEASNPPHNAHHRSSGNHRGGPANGGGNSDSDSSA